MHSDSSERSPQVSTDLFLVLLPFKLGNLLQDTFDLANMSGIVLLRRRTGRCHRQTFDIWATDYLVNSVSLTDLTGRIRRRT